jgi:hypothetical protein
VIEYPTPMPSTIHVYEVRPRKDHRGRDLISDALPFGRLKTSSVKQSRAFFCLHEIVNSV